MGYGMKRGYRSHLPMHLIAVNDKRRQANTDSWPPIYTITSTSPMTDKMKEELSRAAEMIKRDKPIWVVVPKGVEVRRV